MEVAEELILLRRALTSWRARLEEGHTGARAVVAALEEMIVERERVLGDEPPATPRPEHSERGR